MSDWIQKIKTNENEALKEIYLLCREDCLVWLQKDFNCSLDDALDVFQMSVMILYDNVISGKLQHLTSHVKTYIFGVARNKALELQRSHKSIVSDDILNSIAGYITSEDSETSEAQIILASQSLDELGDPCKTVLIQYYYHDKSMEEITTLMSYKNSDTTKNQKYKCLKRLQNIYFSHTSKSLEH